MVTRISITLEPFFGGTVSSTGGSVVSSKDELEYTSLGVMLRLHQKCISKAKTVKKPNKSPKRNALPNLLCFAVSLRIFFKADFKRCFADFGASLSCFAELAPLFRIVVLRTSCWVAASDLLWKQTKPSNRKANIIVFFMVEILINQPVRFQTKLAGGNVVTKLLD
jgi:hypothetical protein